MYDADDLPPSATEDEELYEDIESRNIELDFGTVEIFKERTKYITFLRPMTDDDIIYTIKKNKTAKVIKPSFEMEHYHGVLKPNQDFKMAVTYKPTLPSVKDVEVFDYTDNDYEFIKITLSGAAIGPHCTLSVKQLEFYKTPERKLTEHKVEIINNSGASTSFKIDEMHGDIFQVEPLAGTVKSNSYKFVTVKFRPRIPGTFASKIFCLVWNSEPLMLKVFGVYSTTIGTVDVDLIHFTSHQTFGYAAFLDDTLTIRKDIPPFSLSTCYLDFGSVLINSKERGTLVTSLTNHMGLEILVNWSRGAKSKIFKITPDQVKVSPGSSVQFEVEFNPDENYNVFQETLVAQIDWDLSPSRRTSTNVTVACVPLTCTLRTQGHSFPANEGWVSHFEVLPEVIYWQPCAPGEQARTTVMLRNKSHLPILYKFVPPKKTRVTVKPMMGKFRKMEIIVVQLETEAFVVKTYIEEWKLIINGREDRPRNVYFHGESCAPIIEIGKKNKINAGSVQDGSQKEVNTMMKNQSYYAMSFQFQLIKNTLLSISPMTGTLPANETTKLTIKVTGSQCAPKKEIFTCQMHIIDGNGAISGESHDVLVEIYTTCSYSELCACPSSKDFGRLPFGRRVKTEFEAVNFGDTSIFFQTIQTGEEQHDVNFRIKPCFGEVKPKECKRFCINGIVSQMGNQTLQFGYYNRMVKDSPLVTGDPITLFQLSYFSEFPILQVEEIVEHNFGGIFGKTEFYQHYLKIPKFNKVLREIPNDETVSLLFTLPECELQNKEFYIKLALTNVTDFDMNIIIKRKKICNCKLEEMSVGMSERKKGFNCPHRDSLSMDLQDSRFFAKTTRFLTIKIRYCIQGESQMCYTLELTNNRVIDLYFDIYSIPPDAPRLSTYQEKFALMLKNVYLGTRVAPIQMFWMYNNTNQLLNFEFDTKEVEHMCKRDGFKVLEILNPVDQILPYQNKALLVKFHPIERKTYSIEIDAKYYFPSKENEILFKLLIEGDGVLHLKNPICVTENVPRVSRFTSNFPVSLSLEYVEVKKIPVWSRRKELIFIKNNSRGKIIQYVWGVVRIDKVIEITAEPTYSVLEPKEIQPVVITIKSLSEPCIASFILPCEVEYYSDKIIYQMTREKYLEAENRIDEFMHGEPVRVKRPVNPIKVVDKPETVFASVVIQITTMHTKDLDQHMDVSLQLRQYPNQSIENISKSLLKNYFPEEKAHNFPEKTKIRPPINVNEKMIFCRVLENLLSDVLFSNLLKNHLEKYAGGPLHKYNEFVMDDEKIMERKLIKTPLSNQDIEQHRRREIEHFFNRLKPAKLSNILQNLIYESILKLVQCPKANFNIKKLQEQVEKSLYTCKNKSCSCNTNDDL